MTLTYKDPRDVIIAPVVSEKSYSLIDEGKYTFVVAPEANKTEIKLAIEKIFGVKVDRVNTLNRIGKARLLRYGKGQGEGHEACDRHAEVRLHRHLHGCRLRDEVRDHGYSQLQADDPGSPRLVGVRLRGDHA